ncbi:hypothetical protein AB833_04485 [Chromatiales bacterium (ex Bugula neritina AB1)]|nr:hypothetical protein AB833_04485 [Chromatiales bacterium (ex Bugula neritina AB1)]
MIVNVASRLPAIARTTLILTLATLVIACRSADHGPGLGHNGKSPPLSSIEKHKLPPLNSDFDQQTKAIRTFLSSHSMRQRTAQDIELNLPFEINANPDVPYRGRFLLFHGLNDSPYVWRDFARELAARGFDARAVLFEGHGSTPEAMLNVSYRDWLTTAREHLDLWREDDIPLYLGGFSMGAVIATLLALEQADIAGLLLVSPAYHSRLNHYLRWSGIYARFKPWVFGGMILEDNPIKYNSIPVNSGWQYYQLTKKLKRRWRKNKITIPTLMVNTRYDSVVDSDYVERVFNKRFVHPSRRLITYHEAPLPDSGEFQQYRDIANPGARIINQSHLGVMYRPENPLFGENGRVLVCNGNEYPVFIACMRARNHWFGAQHTESPDGTPVARTTYNPDFEGVVGDVEGVLKINKEYP